MIVILVCQKNACFYWRILAWLFFLGSFACLKGTFIINTSINDGYDIHTPHSCIYNSFMWSLGQVGTCIVKGLFTEIYLQVIVDQLKSYPQVYGKCFYCLSAHYFFRKWKESDSLTSLNGPISLWECRCFKQRMLWRTHYVLHGQHKTIDNPVYNTHTDQEIQSCMALTLSLEVSGSPWQLYNGAGLIQSQRRMVGLAEMQREKWSGSETFSSRSWCVVAATCSFTEDKTFCLYPNPTFILPLNLSILFA